MPKLAASTRLERKDHLIQAAWRCAARQGLSQMTVDDVCREAQVSKGSFYGYFESKRELLIGLLESDAEELDRVIADLGSQKLSDAERVQRFTRSMLERGDDSAKVRLLAELWSSMLSDAGVRLTLANSIARRRERLRSWIEDGIASGELETVPANAFASLILALGDGLLLHSALDADAFRWPRIRIALSVLLSGVRAT